MLDTWRTQADRLKADGQLQQACDLYEQICRLAPHRAAGWLQLAETYFDLERMPQCLQALEYALRLNGQDPRALQLAAVALIEVGSYEKAVQMADAVLAIASGDRLAALVNKSTALLRLARSAEALAAADAALALSPEQMTARSNRGSALFGLGRHQEALAEFDQILALQPTHAVALLNRVPILRALHRPSEALAAADAAVAAWPESAVALLNRAAVLLSLGRPASALMDLDHLLLRQPDHHKALLNRSTALLLLGRNEEALAAADRAVALDSASRLAVMARLRALLALGRCGEVLDALATLSVAHAQPDPELTALRIRALLARQCPAAALAEANALLGTEVTELDAILACGEALLWNGMASKSLKWIEKGLERYPDALELLRDRSMILLAMGQRRQALQTAYRLRELASAEHLEAQLVLAGALNANGSFQEALTLLESLPLAVRDNWQFHAKRGEALAGLQQFPVAKTALAQAGRLAPPALWASYCNGLFHSGPSDALRPALTPEQVWTSFQFRRLSYGDWDDYAARIVRIQELVEQSLARHEPVPLAPFHALFLPLSPELRLRIAQSEAERLTAAVGPIADAMLEPVDTAPLRIGYVSADFREHPTAHLMRGLFRTHDRRRVEVYGYALQGDDGSAYYQQIKEDCDVFVDLTELNNVTAARRIQADGIHILVDLMVYTDYARPEIFALRPAPIQVNWLGYPGTSGAAFLDYWLVDPIVLPTQQAQYGRERPVVLPECYQVNDRWQEIAETGVRRIDQGLPESGFVFCCFNQIQKLEPVMFALWMRILGRVPGSVLWLYAKEDEAQDRLRATAVAHGIDGERLIFAKYLPKDRHLERHRLADLFLDTRIYNAHTTASDALWAGLPVVTCLGDTFPARVAASLLHAVGLAELVTSSLEEYEELAVRLATHPTALAALRDKLASNRLQTPLFDTERCARHLEQAYQLMWQRRVQGLPPAPLTVAALPKTIA